MLFRIFYIYMVINIVIMKLLDLGQERAQLYSLINNDNCTIVPRPVSTPLHISCSGIRAWVRKR